VIARRVLRADLSREPIAGLVLAHDVREETGRARFAKGHILTEDDRETLGALDWPELHLIALEPSELHEAEAGQTIANAVNGSGCVVGTLGGGHWPIAATVRGVVQVDVPTLDAINAIEGLCVYTLYDGQIVDAGEVVGRAKIIPLAIARHSVETGRTLAATRGGVVRVRAFQPLRVGAVVQESLGDRALARFRSALDEKLSWLGAQALEPLFVPAERGALAAGLRESQSRGAAIIAVAGARAMDPLDPTFGAVRDIGGRIVRQGVPAHPGSLCWIARTPSSTIVGMPSCGLFSRATVFDLLLPRLLIGDSLDAAELARLGHGGFLTPAMAYRFPPYRQARARGAIDDSE
jgi:hypothetical protein